MRFAGSDRVIAGVRRRAAKLAVAASVAVAAFAASTALAAAPAFASPAGDLAAATNQARAAAGLPALSLSGDLTAVAQAWAQHLAAANSLSHNPALASQVSNWTVLGENVGMAGDIPSVQKAFMASAHHRDNILDPRYTQMGVGAATSTYPSCGCQVLWVVVDFRRPASTPAPANPAPAPARPAPAPARPAPAQPAPAQAKPASQAPESAASHPAANPPAASNAGQQPVAPSASATPSPTASAAALRTQLVEAASAPANSGEASDPVSRLLSFASDVASN